MRALDYINNVFKHPTSKEDRIVEIIDYCERLMEQKINYYYARIADFRNSGDANDIQRADELQRVIDKKVNYLRNYIQNESSFLRQSLHVDGNSYVIRSRNMGINIDNYDQHIEKTINNVVIYGGIAQDDILQKNFSIFNNNRLDSAAFQKNNERNDEIRRIQNVEAFSTEMNSHMTQSSGQRPPSRLREATTIDFDFPNENMGQQRGNNSVNTGHVVTGPYPGNSVARRHVDSIKGKSPTGSSRKM